MPIITLTAISFIFVLVSFASAIEFEINFPQTVDAQDSFEVSLLSSETEIHDVKIFVQDENKKIVSQIYNEVWKSPHYYIKSAFPENKEFEIKVISSSGDYEICARLRLTGKSSFSEKCGQITVNSAGVSTPEKNESNKEKISKKKKESKKEDNNESITPQINNLKNISYSPPVESVVEEKPEKIVLSSVKKSIPPQPIKYDKTKTLVLYGFIFLCIIIILVLALNKL